MSVHVMGAQHSPEPLAAEARHREDPPVDEDTELGLVEPLRQRSGVDGVPVRFIFCSAGADKQNRQDETHG